MLFLLAWLLFPCQGIGEDPIQDPWHSSLFQYCCEDNTVLQIPLQMLYYRLAGSLIDCMGQAV